MALQFLVDAIGNTTRDMLNVTLTCLHSACIVADKIITFGGSANPSDTVLVIDLSEGTPSSKRLEERGQVTVVAPQVRGLVGPVCRTSVVGLQVALCSQANEFVSNAYFDQIGSYFFIHGGFHLDFDQLGDIWVHTHL